MNYFDDCTTIEMLKARYEELIDTCTERQQVNSLQAIAIGYEAAVVRLQKERGLNQEQLHALMEESEHYRSVLEKIMHLPRIIIELVGSWLWVTGDTRPVHRQLRDAGMCFCRSKTAWYCGPKDTKKQPGSSKSLDHWRNRYGSQSLNPIERNSFRNN